MVFRRSVSMSPRELAGRELQLPARLAYASSYNVMVPSTQGVHALAWRDCLYTAAPVQRLPTGALASKPRPESEG